MGSNRLGASASPYLRQHARNPVHWMEWGEAAFEEARTRGVPVLLSIGYAACHWCHVMAHESFENEALAAQMNAGFVNVKVDREERPDIDQIYMGALHALGEQGGWPLTMFLTPAGEPFWGGTYFPPEARYGRPGFGDVLAAVSRTWERDRERITHNTTHLMAHLRSAGGVGTGAVEPAAVDRFAEGLLGIWDVDGGGPQGAPKFPNAPMVEALWRAWHRGGDQRYRDAVRTTLARMAQGGIYDHVGGGLHRYAVDAKWLVPHFEKMLYDQGHFIEQCSWFADDRMFRSRIERSIGWLEREMRTDGAFASSLDADTPTPEGGVEGLTYTWTADEVPNAVAEAYDLAEPNFEGRAIPNRIGRDGDPDLGTELDAMLRVRLQRAQPARDDKVLTDWNAAFAASWITAAQALERADWIEAADQLIDAIDLTPLPHSRLGERQVLPALLSDHVEVIHALIASYCATGRAERLASVREHLTEIEAHYLVDGVPVLTHEDAPGLIVRPSAFQDGPDPSPASRLSVALSTLEALGEPVPGELKDRLEGALAAHLGSARFGTAGAANALDHAMNVATLVLVGAPPEWASLAAKVANPNLVIVNLRRAGALPQGHAARELAPKAPVAILCRNRACRLPAGSADALDALLDEMRAG